MNTQDRAAMDGKTVYIHDPVDIIALRMEVRQFARKIGLSPINQSSISIATSDLAYKIGLDSRSEGSIQMHRLVSGYRTGLKLTVITRVTPEERFSRDVFEPLQGLVDEFIMDLTSGNYMVIHLVKWAENQQQISGNTVREYER